MRFRPALHHSRRTGLVLRVLRRQNAKASRDILDRCRPAANTAKPGRCSNRPTPWTATASAPTTPPPCDTPPGIGTRDRARRGAGEPATPQGRDQRGAGRRRRSGPRAPGSALGCRMSGPPGGPARHAPGRRSSACSPPPVARRGLAGIVPRLFLIEEEYIAAISEAEAAWLGSLLEELTAGTFPRPGRLTEIPHHRRAAGQPTHGSGDHAAPPDQQPHHLKCRGHSAPVAIRPDRRRLPSAGLVRPGLGRPSPRELHRLARIPRLLRRRSRPRTPA